MKTFFTLWKTFAVGLFAAALVAAPLHAAPVGITATLEPASLALGESAQLAVTVQGSQAQAPDLPSVDGLDIAPMGQSSSFQSINGAVTASVGYLYQVTPTRVGTFTIPAVRLAGGASSQPLVLRVLKRAGNGAQPSAGNRSSLPPPRTNWPADDATAAPNGEMAFLRVALPKQELYVGELVPVQIKAYFRAGLSASLNGLPALSSDAFTLNKLDGKPEQTQEVIGSQTYTVLTWPSALAAVKAGEYPFNLELPVLVRVPEKRAARPRSRFGSMFDDSFFDDAFADFFGRVSEKPLTLHTDAEPLKILPLPSENRPKDFTGAVGRFEVSAEATPGKVTAGDPVTLRHKVSGQGNFDRVTASGLEASADWRTYKSTAHFEPADNAAYEGTKTFEQAVVPLKSGAAQIPALAFSYFDPDARRYVTRTTSPIAVEVASGNITPSIAAAPTSSATSAPTKPAPTAPTELGPNQVEAGRFVSSLRPVLFAPWFLALQAVLIAGCVTFFLLLRRRERLSHDPEAMRNQASETAIREQLRAMDEALETGQVTDFFTAAQRALREKLAGLWHLAPSAVTAAVVTGRLNGGGETIRAVFRAAETSAYSGQQFAAAELHQWRRLVHDQINQLEDL